MLMNYYALSKSVKQEMLGFVVIKDREEDVYMCSIPRS